MIFYILMGAIVLAMALVWYFSYRENKPWKGAKTDATLSAIWPLTIGAVVTVIYLMCTASYFQAIEGQGRVASQNDTPIVSAGNGNKTVGAVGGGIFAFYGEVNGVRVVNFITKDDQNGLHLRQSEAQNTTIYEQDGAPHITEQHWLNHVDLSFWVPWMTGDKDGGVYTYVYVPKGSVSTEFSIDNK